MMHDYLKIPGWMQLKSLQYLAAIASKIPSNGNILEIGAFYGRCTYVFGQNKPHYAHLHTIDHWAGFPYSVLDNAPLDIKGSKENLALIKAIIVDDHNEISQKDANNLWKKFVGYISMSSYEILDTLDIDPTNYNQFDIILHDGSHIYNEVKQDLLNWYPKLKPDGLFIIDDYNAPSWPGVTQAVDEFIQEYDLAIEHIPGGLTCILPNQIAKERNNNDKENQYRRIR